MGEVLAIRLYTGPGYLPLNTFLRELAKLGAAFRKKIAGMHELSYSSTVKHLINGLRKLVRVNPKTDGVSLFRAIRGELPEAFWLQNVLWEVKCGGETSDGFHCGADV